MNTMKLASYDMTTTSHRMFTSASHLTTTAKLVEAGLVEPEENDELSLSNQAKNALEQSKPQLKAPKSLAAAALRYDGYSKPKDSDELQLNILLRFLEALTGKKFSFPKVEPQMQNSRPQHTIQNIPAQNGAARQLSIEQTSMYYEYESVSFSAQGIVKTEDGREIAFDVSLNMSREYAEYSSVSARVGLDMNLCDPLVINYGGSAASLTGTKYSFDLLADGVSRNISFAGEGSGFLALDKNGDGLINDGSELFGPQSGDGFADLRKYDGDGNGWIDENDAVFDKLSVWTKDSNGNDVLLSLKQADVGAIYLGNVSTEFTLGNSNEADGVIRSTGIFLKESGGAGTIQHVDLKI